MSRELQRLYATDDTFREVANLLFGDGADNLVSKLSPTPEDKDRRKRAVTAGLSAVGATAGTAGLGYAGVKMSQEYKKAPKTLSRLGRAKTAVKSEKLGAVLIPLEVAGLGGELMATKILHGDTKKKTTVKKSEPGASDLHLPTAGRLKRMAAQQAVKQAPKVKKGALVAIEASTAKVSKSTEVTWEGEFSKVDADKRQVFGWASIVEMNGQPVVDLQGDYIDIDEIEKSAYDYVIKSRKGGDMHRRNADDTPVHSSDMIESFLVTPEKIEKMGLPASTPIGWWVGYQINDDDAWNLVKTGKRTGFSIHGRGQRTNSEI